MQSENELIPVRMLNEYVYCPRLCYIEWIQGDFVDNKYTLDGTKSHKGVDKKRGDIVDNSQDEFKIKSLKVSSEDLGIISIIDVIEGANNEVVPVDYKRGKAPKVKGGAREPEKVQLCAQGLILRDNGFVCEYGYLYFVKSKSKVRVNFDDELVESTLNTIESMKRLRENPVIPSPLIDSLKCPSCSLVGICLPDETNFFKQDSSSPRLLYPSRDDGLGIYITDWGCSLRKKGERIVVIKEKETLQEVPINKITSVSIYGDCYITTSVLRELVSRDITICYFSYGGWFYGYSSGVVHKNIELKMKQFEISGNTNVCLEIAKSFVTGKIKNCRTLVRRNDNEPSKQVLDSLSGCIKKVKGATNLDILLGIEGQASKIYFSRFYSLLKSDTGFSFEGRNKRPPKDPVNATISYLYGLLAKECFVKLLSVGFDPYLGFYHQRKYGKPSLALDLMEEFRSIICDSVAIKLFNTGELTVDDFIMRKSGVMFKKQSKKKVIRAYEKRMNTEIKHPIFGYSVSYRRIIEVQSRLLARKITGEIKEYPYFYVR